MTAKMHQNLENDVFREYPDLEGEMPEFPSEGRRARVLLFKEQVFKGPLKEEDIPFIEQERRVLEHLEGRGLPVPTVATVGQEAVFFGMARMEGVPLVRSWLDMMVFEDQQAIAKQIARFIKDFANAFEGLERTDIVQRKMNLTPSYNDFLTMLENSELKQELGRHYAECSERLNAYMQKIQDRPRMMLNYDLNPGNILVDSWKNRVIGFIDFGMIDHAVPETAFHTLYQSYPPDFVKLVLKEYRDISGVQVDFKDILLLDMAYAVTRIDDALQNHKGASLSSMISDISATLEELDDIEKSEQAVRIRPVVKARKLNF